MSKRGEREPLKQNFIRKCKSKKKNPEVLKILKFRSNKIDWDCKILKVTPQKSKKIDLQNNSVENS